MLTWLICKDLTQRTTNFQKAIVNSQLHINGCSRDSSEILQKVQRGESTNLILHSVFSCDYGSLSSPKYHSVISNICVRDSALGLK